MTEPTSGTRDDDSAQRDEPTPEAASPFTHADDAAGEGRDVDRDVEDNADLDG